jgi:hypothetical protein
MPLQISKFIFGILIALSLLQTNDLMKSHFTHVDDLGVAYTLLNQHKNTDQMCNLRFDAAKQRWYSGIAPLKELVCADINSFVDRIKAVPKSWTYAPFQFWFSQAILSPVKSFTYEQVKFYGRLPSFLFFIFGLICFHQLLIRKVQGFSSTSLIPIILTAVAVFSLEQRIMASQMHSYAIGLLSFSICLWALFEIIDLQAISYKRLFFASAIFAISISMQYQAVLLVAAGLISIGVALAYKSYQGGIVRARILKYLSLLLATPIFAYLLVGNILGMSQRGVSWNAGPSGEFKVSGDGFFDRTVSLIRLIINESAYNAYSIASAYELNELHASIFGLAILFVCLLGLYFLVKNSSKQNKFFLLFSASYVLILIGFVHTGLLTFSPTRHLLYHLPLMLIWFGYGLLSIHIYLKPRYFQSSIIAISIIYFAGSLLNFQVFADKRRDPISNEVFQNAISSNPSDFWIVGPYDLEIQFMPALKAVKVYALNISNCADSNLKIEPKLDSLKFIWYSKRNEIAEGDSSMINYINNAVLPCSKLNGQDLQVSKLIKIKDIVYQRSQIEVDLSNKTHNGTNSAYFQQYKIVLEKKNIK